MTMSPHEVLTTLRDALAGELPDIDVVGSGLTARVDSRYGRLTLRLDHDPQAASIRVSTVLPPPAGAGPEFLTWCLSTNTLYWDVKIGLDPRGMLLVLADVDLEQVDLAATAHVLLARVSAMGELIDDDLVPYLLDNQLATPAQRERWQAWAPRA